MIECLSNPHWINPQIDVLLYLQNLRVGRLEIFDKFFLSVTIFGEFWLPTLICAVIYWCIDFRAGIYMFSLESINALILHFLKMLACVYRPWVLSDKIHPSELAIPYAKGYSFPSGHSAMSSSILGGVAYLYRKNRWLCTLLILTVFIVGFSRLWLGVHTLQDVVCGLILGFTLVFTLNKMIDWAEKNSNRYLYLLAFINLLAILALIHINFFNTYRIDYFGGELLVNPQKSIYVTTVVYGFVLGLINGCFLCRRFFPFNPKESAKNVRIIRGIVGSLITLALLKYILKYVIMNVLPCFPAFLVLFIIGITITFIYPIIFIKTESYLFRN